MTAPTRLSASPRVASSPATPRTSPVPVLPISRPPQTTATIALSSTYTMTTTTKNASSRLPLHPPVFTVPPHHATSRTRPSRLTPAALRLCPIQIIPTIWQRPAVSLVRYPRVCLPCTIQGRVKLRSGSRPPHQHPRSHPPTTHLPVTAIRPTHLPSPRRRFTPPTHRFRRSSVPPLSSHVGPR
jgi:hypothetical protein